MANMVRFPDNSWHYVEACGDEVHLDGVKYVRDPAPPARAFTCECGHDEGDHYSRCIHECDCEVERRDPAPPALDAKHCARCGDPLEDANRDDAELSRGE